MEIIAIITLAMALAFSLILTPLVRSLAIRIGFVDKPGERKIHSREIAYGGGIAVALAVLAALTIIYLQTISPIEKDPDDPPPITLAAIATGAAGALLIGLVDDRYKLSPLTKLIGQIGLAIIAVVGGVRITAFIGDNWFMKCVTTLWIVLITNSFNLLDNMDGLCAGTVAIASGMLAIVSLDSGQTALVLALASICGASLGFLRYNRAPASIFLGDTGSLFVGYSMATLTAVVTYYRHNKPSHLAIGIPVLILAIPLYDTFSVILIRLKEKRPIMRGDNSHFSHRLVDLGMNRRQAVTTIHLACLAIGIPATILGQLSERSGLLIIGQAFMVITLVALLERAGRYRAMHSENSPWMNKSESGRLDSRPTRSGPELEPKIDMQQAEKH